MSRAIILPQVVENTELLVDMNDWLLHRLLDPRNISVYHYHLISIFCMDVKNISWK